MSLFDDTVLATDSDLTAWESKMPALAQKATCYTGKRQLAKTFLAKQLIKRGVDMAALTNPAQLKDAAVFKELELMFRDMAEKNESIATTKADHYARLFDDELELVVLTVSTGTVRPTVTSLPLLRA